VLSKLCITFAVLGASLAATGAAGAGNSSVPVPGTADCQGHLIAISNHSSGSDGASGNPNASAGPGYFLHSSTHAEIAAYVADYCG
jgi:hypothetical protein